MKRFFQKCRTSFKNACHFVSFQFNKAMLIYLPGSPSALLWPYEWAMVLGWIILGVILWFWARREQRLPEAGDAT